MQPPTPPALAQQLETAWQLRRDVLPLLSRSRDLVCLALALPCALARPACDVIATSPQRRSPREPFYAALVSAAADGDAETVRALSREPFRSALFGARYARHARSVRWASDATLRRLLSPPYRMAAAEGCADASHLCGVVQEACREGYACVLSVVFPLALLPTRVAADSLLGAAQRGLSDACALGHPRVVSALLATRLPLTYDPALRARCLALACDSGCPETVRLLARAPVHANGWDARQDACWSLRTACAQGHAGVVAALACDPFCLGREEAATNNCQALLLACRNGHADVVRLLGQWPYNLERDDAVRSGALEAAVRLRRKRVLRVLREPPFCFAVDASFDSEEDGCPRSSSRGSSRSSAGSRVLRGSFSYLRKKAAVITRRLRSSSGERRRPSGAPSSQLSQSSSSSSSKRPSGSYTYRGRKGIVRARERHDAAEGSTKVQFWNMKAVRKVSLQQRLKHAITEFARSVIF
eukprot:m51a1_g3704 hypothetical protein (473) ;mRNA; r:423335-424966